MSYTIESTGQDGWLAYRYQYSVEGQEYFGYAETESDARARIAAAGVSI